MYKRFLVIGAILGALSVILGAFAAHKLKEMVPPETVSTFETGVRYQFYHTFAILITALLMKDRENSLLKWAAYLFIGGIILFSGSLYILTALKATDTVGMNGVGIITPFGGLLFIAGWAMLAIGISKRG